MINPAARDTMPVPLKVLLRILAVVAVGITRVIAAVAQVFAEVFGIVAYEILVPVVAVLQEAEERLSKHADGPVITTRLQGVDCPMCEAGEPHRHTL